MLELNADVGEGGEDGLLMPLVDRVSIACGGHYGDADSMRSALLLARQIGLLAGAHPSYPDPVNFGRVAMMSTPAQITGWVVEQTRMLRNIADSLEMKLFHVKPHGALYNKAAVDEKTGRAVIHALHELEGLVLVALAGSPLVGWARDAGLAVLEEAFADRRYLRNGRLAPRAVPGAGIESPEEAASQALAIALGRPVKTLGGEERVIRAQTLCLHGDDLGALARARAVALALETGK